MNATVLHIEPFSLGGCVTIDTSSNDDGFLACARTGWPHPPGDSTSSQAAANLAACGATTLDTTGNAPSNNDKHDPRNMSLLVLVLHGNSGIISTDDGMTPHSPLGYISSSNFSTWQLSFAQIHHGQFLTLCGCDCGAGASGADFLYDLATTIGMPVRGRTGLVYLTCPGAYLSYENGSVWQAAEPGVRPTPIPSPSYQVERSRGEFLFSGTIPVKRGQIRRIEMTHSRGTIVLDAKAADDFLALANVSQPYTINGAPEAILTGKVTVFWDEGESESKRELNLFNDRLLQDVEHLDTFYLCSGAFSENIRNLVR